MLLISDFSDFFVYTLTTEYWDIDLEDRNTNLVLNWSNPGKCKLRPKLILSG